MSAKRKVGRPSAYRPEYAKQAYRLCLLGATNVDLAAFFEVSDTTIDNWLKAHQPFLGALKSARDLADGEVAKSLYRRALGYSHRAVKIVADAKTGDVVQVPYREHYPPDTGACAFWLKNRRPDLWRDRHQHDISVEVSGVLRVPASDALGSWTDRARLQQGGKAAGASNGANGGRVNGNGNGHP